MNEGFLSNNIRDALALLGLLLAIGQTILSLLTIKSNSRAPAELNQQARNNDRKFNYPSEISSRFRILYGQESISLWSPILIFLSTLVIAFICSIGAHHSPQWLKEVLRLILIIAALVQHVALALILASIDARSTLNQKLWFHFSVWRPFLAGLLLLVFILSLDLIIRVDETWQDVSWINQLLWAEAAWGAPLSGLLFLSTIFVTVGEIIYLKSE